MNDDERSLDGPAADAVNPAVLSAAVDRGTFQADLDNLRAREKAHTREGDAIAAARRRLPVVEVDAHLMVIGPHGPITVLDAFEGRRQLIAYYFMWRHPGRHAQSSVKVAHGSPPRSQSCPTCIFATSPSRSSARVLTMKAFATANSWGGTCRGTQHSPPSTRSSSGAPPLDVPCLLHPGGRPRVRNLLDEWPRRGGDGLQLCAHGPHKVRAPRAVGELTLRVAATVHLHADEQRRADMATRVARRTPDRSVAPPGSGALRRPRPDQALRGSEHCPHPDPAPQR